PSSPVVLGRLGRRRVAFLARHGERHQFAPHRVNYRANVRALHDLGATRIVAVNAVGGMAANTGPRAIVVPDQLIDYTWGRATSFSDVEGVAVEHVDFSNPYTPRWRRLVLEAAV